jgi:adenylate kinase
MRLAVTGTPGTGKTTATEHLDTALDVIHLNDLIRTEGLTTGHDEERESAVADLNAVSRRLDSQKDFLVESHLAHHVPVDRVVVLRCHPETIESRLERRAERSDSIAENAESEALDLILTEAVEIHGQKCVYEIETTDRTPDEVAEEIEAVIEGSREPRVGTVSYLEYL